MRLVLALFFLICFLFPTYAEKWDTKSDTWVGVDNLGRKVLSQEDGLSSPNDRQVGMFYYLCLSSDGRPNMPFHDVTELLKENVDNPEWGVEYESHFWGRPLLGYYDNQEKYIYQKHMQWLCDAGIDFLFFDTTNGWLYIPSVKILMEVLDEREAKGLKVPKLAFMLNQKDQQQHVQTLYDQLYSKPQYDKYWFNYQGKPLILVEASQAPNEVIRNHFTFRKSWAWMEGKKTNEWPWLENYPQAPGWSGSTNNVEQISVSVAQHAHTRVGKSFHKGSQPKFDKYGLCDSTSYGLYFEEQWERAHKVNAPILMITQFNEWIAMRMIAKNQGEANACRPGGNPVLGESWFIDAYNAEFNRDIEPSVDPLILDNYYLQMMSHVRKYKGVNPLPESTQIKKITIDENMDQWNDVDMIYRDDVGDIQHRQTKGFQYIYPMSNTTGANDIVLTKVAQDQASLFFYVETAADFVNTNMTNFIRLFINSDKNYSTGWAGYDYAVQKSFGKYYLMKSLSDTDPNKWEKVSAVTVVMKGNKMHFAIPKQLLKLQGALSFDFKWCDNFKEMWVYPGSENVQTPSVMDFYTVGDAAPNGRLNYRFSSKVDTSLPKVSKKKR